MKLRHSNADVRKNIDDDDDDGLMGRAFTWPIATTIRYEYANKLNNIIIINNNILYYHRKELYNSKKKKKLTTNVIPNFTDFRKWKRDKKNVGKKQ